MAQLGAHTSGISIMKEKALFKVLKIKGISSPAANILKQEVLSLGGEAATAHGVINCSVERSDILVFATLKQLSGLIEKLKQHPFGLKELANNLQLSIFNYQLIPAPLKIGNREFGFGEKTFIMGILNVTPDSFSDGGRFLDADRAAEQAEKLVNEGADILDIGGESTRPGAYPVSADEEIRRILPVIKWIRANLPVPISVDTRKASVAETALNAGADMVNDVSGLRFDPKMAGVIAKHNKPVCIMHCQGDPKTMQENPFYSDIISEITDSLEESIEIAKNAGILCEKIIIDPGIGFGKTVADNLEIIKHLKEFRVLGRPIMIGPSRKSYIGALLGKKEDNRVAGTAAAVAVAISNGADIIRVHDVAEMLDITEITDAITRRQDHGKEKSEK
ncbi:MAG: dihydropteroate synthase [Candidatus Margulisbacteria bacterium]|nr:dihydropteroate synthase [Candidatus Margulisiibacteriota bacterium]